MEGEKVSLRMSLSRGGGSWAGQWKGCVERAAGLGRVPHLSGTSLPGLATASLHSH